MEAAIAASRELRVEGTSSCRWAHDVVEAMREEGWLGEENEVRQ